MLAETSRVIAFRAARPCLASPIDGSRTIRAVLFDLDGTLYRQDRIRALMAIELAAHMVRHPMAGRRTLRVLSAYRRAQEALRGDRDSLLRPATQSVAASTRTGVAIADVERIVTEWMDERPLKHIRGCRAFGLLELLALLEERRLPVGVLSDYPAARKLAALEVADHFSLVLCSTDPEIAAFKPNPRGVLRACELWQLSPHEVLVVGDRFDVDARAAAAAYTPCVIISHRQTPAPHGCVALPSFKRLCNVLDDHNDRR
jgi:HAD superfamily hydrolase (TIGR01549 family)